MLAGPSKIPVRAVLAATAALLGPAFAHAAAVDEAAAQESEAQRSEAQERAVMREPGRLPRVTVALLPNGIPVGRLAAVDGISPGLMSAGLGNVLPDQTYLDVSQGARVFNSLYDSPLPLVLPRGDRVPQWRAIRERAASAPDEIRPGLLTSTLSRELSLDGAFTSAVGLEPELVVPALMGADERGRIARSGEICPGAPRCRPPVVIRNALLGELPRLVASLRGDDILIAIERPPPERGNQLAIGIAGRGFSGNLISDTTRTPGYVLSTDVAPTILERYGIEPPAAMTGSPIRSEGRRDPAALVELDRRMSEIVPRRGPVLGVTALVWAGLAALAMLSGRTRRHGLRLLALSIMLLPAVLLGTAWLQPGLEIERALALLAPPALAAAATWLLPGWRAVAAACAVTVLAHVADLLAGSPLTALSLMGPNPGLGVRFYGIGNELGATLAVLLLIGTGAGLAGFAPRLDRRLAAAVFVAVAVPVAAVFAAGRFGADVGSAMVIPASAVVAAAVVLARPLLALAALAVPALGLAGLAAVDALSGGDSHFQRAILDAEGPGELADTAARRLRLTGRSFVRGASGPFLPLTVAVIGLGFAFRERIREWLSAAPPALGAGFAAAVFATLLGTVANDSGLLLLEVGVAYLLVTAGYAWAEWR